MGGLRTIQPNVSLTLTKNDVLIHDLNSFLSQISLLAAVNHIKVLFCLSFLSNKYLAHWIILNPDCLFSNRERQTCFHLFDNLS